MVVRQKHYRFLASAGLAALPVLGVAFGHLATPAVEAQTGGGRVPARVTFRDDTLDRIRSDAQGSYTDDGSTQDTLDDCVISFVQGNFAFLRTRKGSCSPVVSRSVVIDLGDPVTGPFSDGSGSTSDYVNDAFGQIGELYLKGATVCFDVRLIVEKLWAQLLANGTPTSLPINLSLDNQNTAFVLEFEENLTITGNNTVRSVEADASNWVARLVKHNGDPKKKPFEIGRFKMRFKATFEKFP